MEIQKQPPSFDPALVKTILSQKCPTHSAEYSDLIHLSPTLNSRRICKRCKKAQNILDSEVISIQDVIQTSSETHIPKLEGFTSNDISQKIQFLVESQTIITKKIDSYYVELLYAIEVAINRSKESIINKLATIVDSYVKNLKSVKEQTFQMGQLQDIILSQSRNEEMQLTQFFQSAYKISTANNKFIKENMNSFNRMKEHFSTLKTNDISLKFSQLIQDINLIPVISLPVNSLAFTAQNLLPSVNAMSFAEKFTSNLEIIRESPTSILHIKNKGQFYCEAYLNYRLDNDQKYVLIMQFQQHAKNDQPYFVISLFNQLNKNLLSLVQTGLSYCEAYGGDIGKIIKGKQVWAGNKNIGKKKQIEFRIHLEKNLIQVGSHPDFKNVAELVNPKAIDQSSQYHIGFCIQYPLDSIRILEFKTVSEFDGNIN